MPAFHCWYVTQADSWHYCHTLYKLNWLFTADLTLKGKIGLVFCDGFLHMVHICIGYIKTSPIFRSTPKSRPNNIYMGLKCPSVRPSNKSFSDSDEIWYVGRGWRVMHDGMPYDQIRGQGHETFKVRNSSIISSAIFNVSWQMTTDSETTEQYLTFVWSRFLISVTWLQTWNGVTLIVVYLLREVSNFGNFSTDTGSTLAETTNWRDYELGRVSDFGGVDRSPVRG